jgi:PIN domain nuclease of toxin-antitoxin system
MKLLLDTHAFIWFVENDENLPSRIRIQIEDIENDIFISIVSLWEIAIKTSLGKLEIAIDIPAMISKIEANGFSILPIFPEHTICVSSLPFHHRDPFDRMLIAQTITEKIKIVSRDGVFDDYDVDCIW